jgi:hypothetical protein
MKKMQ